MSISEIVDQEQATPAHDRWLARMSFSDAHQLEALAAHASRMIDDFRVRYMALVNDAAKLADDIDRADEWQTTEDRLAELYEETAKGWPEYAARLRRAAE